MVSGPIGECEQQRNSTNKPATEQLTLVFPNFRLPVGSRVSAGETRHWRAGDAKSGFVTLATPLHYGL